MNSDFKSDDEGMGYFFGFQRGKESWDFLTQESILPPTELHWGIEVSNAVFATLQRQSRKQPSLYTGMFRI
ncbi:hypothetical protein DRW41_08240 [Neobacillus piezotolerans]|uniref:Uncharacterized protein n=1 Tax=Neobacillus piezotolerans TaxID=2259171 RepID=A0A3D8GTK5_9BACI|nr:hypothetical protein [Neobacillus piezotolerans]RDU37800.1 hypothetical protein DRW41_08240 [Neobacillus piezotolerans]